MIDLHTHTVHSDGALIPAELARRAKVAGYRALAFTDHADDGNIGHLLERTGRIASEYSSHLGIDLFAGAELTHTPPALIASLARRARDLGAALVVMHGETLVEPVERGTNLAAIEAGVDILAHPGLISDEEAALAAERGVFLEITTRKGHSLTNGLVAAMARKHGAGLVINNDAHAPGDLVSRELRERIALGAGLTADEYREAEANSEKLLRRMIGS
jgi:histidinol phosphatase-like PHP family hydrolase